MSEAMPDDSSKTEKTTKAEAESLVQKAKDTGAFGHSVASGNTMKREGARTSDAVGTRVSPDYHNMNYYHEDDKK